MFKLLQRPQTLTIDDMLALTREHIVGTAAFFPPLAALCMGVMEKAVAAEIRNRFFLEIADLLARAAPAWCAISPACRAAPGHNC